jgi:hypothetical protein
MAHWVICSIITYCLILCGLSVWIWRWHSVQQTKLATTSQNMLLSIGVSLFRTLHTVTHVLHICNAHISFLYYITEPASSVEIHANHPVAQNEFIALSSGGQLINFWSPRGMHHATHITTRTCSLLKPFLSMRLYVYVSIQFIPVYDLKQFWRESEWFVFC